MDEEMRALVSRFAEYLEKRSEQQLRCFYKYETQVEGWFKGELIYFLDREKREGRLHDIGREKQLPDDESRKTDVVIQFDESRLISWVELKHWIGRYNRRQNNRDWSPSLYFSNYTRYDVEKLSTMSNAGDKFMLVLFTPKPDSNEWNSGVEEFNTQFHPLSVCSLTNPSDYPEYFFLGLLHVVEVDQH
jgi:hypothetical protein